MLTFEPGWRVRKDKVMKVENAEGTVIKVTKEYVVVNWDLVNGDWHYTHEQANNLQVVEHD